MNDTQREINETIERALTARHVLEALEHVDPDTPVMFVCSYGDYHNTQQALPVGEIIDCSTADLKTTAYSQSGLALVNDNLEDDDEPRERDEDEDLPIIIFRDR